MSWKRNQPEDSKDIFIRQNGSKVKGSEKRRQKSSSFRLCVICCFESNMFSVGECRHPICLECATRIRVLGMNSMCSHCRLDLPQVYFVTCPVTGTWDRWTPPKTCLTDKKGAKFGINFANEEAMASFHDFLAHVCTVCENEPDFAKFSDLRRHMSKQHDVFYCDICVENLQLFTWERKCYSRKQLAVHRRVGDSDDKSHRGHPQCRFCDDRLFDNDILYRHLRRDHFYCQLCDVDGFDNIFYPAYDELKVHYKKQHFYCNMGQCRTEQTGMVFRTEMDLKVHQAKQHVGGRQQIQLEFNLPERNRPIHQQQQPQGRGQGTRTMAQRKTINLTPSTETNERTTNAAERKIQGPHVTDFQLKSGEFPSLSGNSAKYAIPLASSFARQRQSGKLLNDVDDFPALSHQEKAKSAMKSVEESHLVVEKQSKSFVVIDDDENFPSFSATNRMVEERSETKGTMQRNEDNGQVQQMHHQQQLILHQKKHHCPQQQQRPSLFQALTNSKWGSNRPVNLSQAAECLLVGEEQFPALNQGGKSKVWSKGPSLFNSAIVGATVNNKTRKMKDLPVPDMWPKMDTAVDLEQKMQPDERKVVTNGEMLRLDSNAKLKVRRIAKQKQRIDDELRPTDTPVVPELAPNSQLPVKMPPPGLNLTSPPGLSKVQSHSQPVGGYIRAGDFDSRNRHLFHTLACLFTPDQLDDFKAFSCQFRKHLLDADAYLQMVANLLDDQIRPIMPELIVLLPDIDDQRQLLDSYGRWTTRTTGARSRQTAGEDDVRNVGGFRFRLCVECGQVLGDDDWLKHADIHSINCDFPSLHST